MKSFVAYYRVSTKRQGDSGLGLEGQQASVMKYVANRGNILAEFTEVESGKKNNRAQLAEAIRCAKKHGATLVIAKLDRLSRNVSFISSLMASKADFLCVDMPDATPLTIHIFAAIAENERETIVGRIKTALEAKRARGERLGNVSNLTEAGRALGAAAMKNNAQAAVENIQAKHLVKLLLNQTHKPTLREVAAELNEKGYRTRRGSIFSATQVLRLAKP